MDCLYPREIYKADRKVTYYLVEATHPVKGTIVPQMHRRLVSARAAAKAIRENPTSWTAKVVKTDRPWRKQWSKDRRRMRYVPWDQWKAAGGDF